MTTFIIILVCALAYAVKGGSLGEVIPKWNKWRESNVILDAIMDGKVVSSLMIYALAIWLFGFIDPTQYPEFIVMAWIISVIPSMGEEHGAVGDYKGALPVYLERAITKRGRSYDVKKGIQRGLVFGAAFTLATGFVPFIWFSLLFVPMIFVGQSLNRLILKQPGWTLAEPLIGGAVVGIPLAMYVASL